MDVGDKVKDKRKAFEEWAKRTYEPKMGENWQCVTFNVNHGDKAFAAFKGGIEYARRTPSASTGKDGLPELPKPEAWMVPVDGVFEYFATKRAAELERAAYEHAMGADAKHEDPEPLFTAEKVRQAQREAVAADRRVRGNAPVIPDSSRAGDTIDARNAEIADLRAQLARLSQGVPEGWTLVPIEPTPKMIAAMQFRGEMDIAIGHAKFYKDAEEDYAAMLEAAPVPPLSSEPQEEKGEKL